MDVAFFLMLLLIPVYLQLRGLKRNQTETAERLTSQLHAVYNTVKQQRQMLDQIAASVAAPPAESNVSSASDVPPKSPDATPTPIVGPEFIHDKPREESVLPVRPAGNLVAATSTPAGNTADLRSGAAARKLTDARKAQYSPPPEVPRQPSRFETAAKDVVRKIWNWIIVGEEHVPEGVSVEFAIASQWLLRIGIMLLVIGVGFFLKYSIENGLLSPLARVALSVVAGLLMLIAGTRILGGAFHIMGQGLLGGGIATLYFSAFAAANFYHLIPMSAAFGAMILVTALSGFIAVRFHSKLTAIIGVLGGYATPVMLSTGAVNFPGLYGYLLVLGVGVLFICTFKTWPLLNYLSFAGNFLLVVGSLQAYQSSQHFWQVMPFLIAFFVLFSTMVFIYNLLNRTKSNLLDVLMLFLNASVFFCLSYWLVEQSYGEKWVAPVTLGLAAFYIAHVWYCLVRRVLDRELMITFTGLSAFFLAVTVPLLLSHEWITVSWAVQAFVMLWVAGKLNSEFLRHVAYCLYLIVLGRFVFLDLPSQYGSSSLADLPMSEYFRQLVERLVMFGVPIGSLALGYRLLTKPGTTGSLAVDRISDISSVIEGRAAARSAVFVVFGMLFLYMHLELNRTLGALYPPLRLPMLTLLWLSVCLLLLLEFARTASQIVLAFLCLFVAAVLGKMLIFDLPGWAANGQFLYEGPYSFHAAGFRLLDFGAVIAFFTFATQLMMKQTAREQEITRKAGWLMGVSGVGMLFLYLTLELNSFLKQYVENLRAGGISILWTMFALAFLVGGISRNIRSVRFAGLTLFLIVTVKVFFVDLARLDQLYRIVAFIVLGVMVLCGSFLYLRSRSTFATKVIAAEADSASAPPLPTVVD